MQRNLNSLNYLQKSLQSYQLPKRKLMTQHFSKQSQSSSPQSLCQSSVSIVDQRIDKIRKKYQKYQNYQKNFQFQYLSPNSNQLEIRDITNIFDTFQNSNKSSFVRPSKLRSPSQYSKFDKEQQQGEVLIKIKNMKQSLLLTKQLDKEKNQNSSFSYSSPSYQRLKQQRQRNLRRYQQRHINTNQNQRSFQNNNEQRENNIDKINTKIKHILSCLKENQQFINESRFSKKYFYNQKQDQKQKQRQKQNMHSFRFKQLQSRQKSNKENHKREEIVKKQEKESLINLYSVQNQNKQKQNIHQDYYVPYFKQSKKQQKNYQYKQIEKIQGKQNNLQKKDDQVCHLHKNYRSKSSMNLNSLTNIGEKTDKNFNQNQKQKKNQRDTAFISSVTGFSKNKSVYKFRKNYQQFCAQDQCKKSQQLNDKISTISQKIKKSQQQKKRLGVQFKPFVYTKKQHQKTQNKPSSFSSLYSKNIKNNKSYSQLYSYKHKYQKQPSFFQQKQYKKQVQNMITNDKFGKLTQSIQQNCKIPSQKPTGDYENVKSLINKNQISVKEFDFFLTMSPNSAQITTERDLNQNSQKSQKSRLNQNFNQKSLISYQRQIQFRNSIDINKQLRKKRLNQIPNVSQKLPEIQKIVQLFSKQVELDENLRNAKNWFQNQYQTNKWKLLLIQIQNNESLKIKQTSSLSQKELKQIFSSSEQEYNPFFSVRQSNIHYEYKILAKSYKQAQCFWQNNIQNKIFKNKSKNKDKYIECLSKQIDLQSKGFFILQDLVRFLNMETSKFYRNRDLILIFRRLLNNNKEKHLEYKSFLNQLTEK